ncbi:MAG: DUF481 domain-containing protein [Gammaproteobacteria bacterium]
MQEVAAATPIRPVPSADYRSSADTGGYAQNNGSGQAGRKPEGQGFSRPGFGMIYNLGFSSTHVKDTTTQLHTELELGWNTSRWETGFKFQANDSWNNGSSTQKRYFIGGRGDYLLTQRGYVWAWANYLYNRYAQFQYQAYETAGYGYKVIDSEWRILRLEAGVGGGQSKTRHLGRRQSGVAETARELFVQRLGSIGEGYFQQELYFTHSPGNLFSVFSLRFVQPIGGGWSFWAGYRLEHNSAAEVPDAVQTTSWISLNVSYRFGTHIYGN